jgi:hypothetical protein
MYTYHYSNSRGARQWLSAKASVRIARKYVYIKSTLYFLWTRGALGPTNIPSLLFCFDFFIFINVIKS